MASAIVVLLIFLVSGNAFGEDNSGEASKSFNSAVSAVAAGDYDGAAKLSTIELNQLLAEGKEADAGAVYLDIGGIAHVSGSFPLAEADYKKGIDLLRQYAKPNDARLIDGLDGLGWLYITWGRYADGSRLMEEARQLADHAEMNVPELIRHLDTQAAYFAVVGRYTDAQKEWNHAVSIGKATYGSDGATYGIVLLHFGQASVLFHDYSTAANMFQNYIDLERRSSSQEMISLAVAKAELGHVYVAMHDLSRARPWLNEAMDALDHQARLAPLMFSMVLGYFGDYYMAQKDWTRAEVDYRQSFDLRRKVLGQNQSVAAAMTSLAAALKKLHENAEAKQLEARAKAIVGAEREVAQQQTVDVLALRNHE